MAYRLSEITGILVEPPVQSGLDSDGPVTGHDRSQNVGKRKERDQETGRAAPEEGRLRPLFERAPARELGRSRPDGGAARPVDAVNAVAIPGVRGGPGAILDDERHPPRSAIAPPGTNGARTQDRRLRWHSLFSRGIFGG